MYVFCFQITKRLLSLHGNNDFVGFGWPNVQPLYLTSFISVESIYRLSIVI